MIPKISKFPMRTEFLQFRRRAKRISSPHVTCYLLPVTYDSRLSVVIPKKVSKLAVVRTWLRRLTYDALWEEIKDKKIDMVVVYKPIKLDKSTKTKAQLISDLQSAIDNL